jgi:probable rRNA maturation factor
MNRVEVQAEETPLPAWSESLGRYAVKAMAALGRNNWNLSVLLCGDKTITELNRQYRNKNEATDVLSFALGAEEPDREGGVRWLPGDIVISLDTLRENARYFETPEDEELRRLIIHGILHLNGMDHQTNDAGEPMLVLQEKLLKDLKEEHILPQTGQGGGR